MNLSMRSYVDGQYKQWPTFAETWIENWPTELAKLSYPQIGIPLEDHEIHALGWLNGVHRHLFNPAAEIDSQALEQKLNLAIGHFPQGAFVRLGSRSPKDTLHGIITRCKAVNGKQAIQLLTSGSARIAYDLRAAIQANYPAWLFVRHWQDIAPDLEFRCFMHQRQLIGISQYFHQTSFPSLRSQQIKENLRRLIQEFFPIFSQHCHLDDVVFDVEISFALEQKVKLIEINPFNELTDACLFSWKRFDFDGSFRTFDGFL